MHDVMQLPCSEVQMYLVTPYSLVQRINLLRLLSSYQKETPHSHVVSIVGTLSKVPDRGNWKSSWMCMECVPVRFAMRLQLAETG